MPLNIEPAKENSSLSEYCSKNGITKEECMKMLNEDIDTISYKIFEKTKNISIITAPMEDE